MNLYEKPSFILSQIIFSEYLNNQNNIAKWQNDEDVGGITVIDMFSLNSLL